MAKVQIKSPLKIALFAQLSFNRFNGAVQDQRSCWMAFSFSFRIHLADQRLGQRTGVIFLGR